MAKNLSVYIILVLAAKRPNVISDHEIVKPRVKVQRLSPCWDADL